MAIYFDLTKTKLHYKFVAHPILTPEQTTEMESHFEESVKKNPRVFNTKKFATNVLKISQDNVEVEVCESDYKRYIWSRNLKYHMLGLQPISSDALFVDDENIYLLNIGLGTQYTAGKCDTVGGTLEFSTDVNESNFNDHVLDHALNEVEEEIEYEGATITKEDLIPFVACYNTHLNKLDILHIVKRRPIKPKNWEGESIEVVKISNLEEWIQNNKERIPEILGNYLYYIARKF